MPKSKPAELNSEPKKRALVSARVVGVHISPRKSRLVADLIRGQFAAEAVASLQHLPKRAAKPILKLLLSAIANAEHNLKLQKENLKINKITVDQGPKIKRFQPRAYGRAGEIRRPTSHIFITLEEVAAVSKKGKKFAFPIISRRVRKEKVEHDHKHDDKDEKRGQMPGEEPKEVKPKRAFFGGRKNILTRKGGEK